MQHPHTLIAAPALAPGAYPPRRLARGWASLPQSLPAAGGTVPIDVQFIDLLGSFRGCGGLARAEEALAWLDGEVEQGLSVLARWIALRQIVSVEWQSQTWLPLFQFDRRDMSLHPQLPPILAELSGVFDAWELAHWFARPNSTLAGLTPAEAFPDDPALVLQAARADRFAIEG